MRKEKHLCTSIVRNAFYQVLRSLSKEERKLLLPEIEEAIKASDNMGKEIAHLEERVDLVKNHFEGYRKCAVAKFIKNKETIKELNKRIKELDKQVTDMGWELNPDKMGR